MRTDCLAVLLLLLVGLSLSATPIETRTFDQPLTPTNSATPNAGASILFLLSASPTSMSIFQGYSGWSTINVATLPGAVGDVSLVTSAPASLMATLSSATVSLPSSPATSILTVTIGATTPPGTYFVIVDGNSGGSLHTLNISVTVLSSAAPSFGVSAVPASLTISAGTNSSFIVSLDSINGFTGDVKLTATVSPNGPSTSLNPTDVTISSASPPGTFTVKIVARSTTPPGTYVAKMIATSGRISHYTSV